MGHCPCHTNWDCGRRVGPLRSAHVCSGCGATVPNSWTSQNLAVQDGNGNAFCSEACERVHLERKRAERMRPCPACRRPYDPARIRPPRVPLNIRCACCCNDLLDFPN